jgi:hypothetical protein
VINLDLSLVKNLRVAEHVRLQLKGEAFNVLNHVNLGFVSGSFSPGADGKNISSTFGTITSARDPRSIQIGAKISF